MKIADFGAKVMYITIDNVDGSSLWTVIVGSQQFYSEKDVCGAVRIALKNRWQVHPVQKAMKMQCNTQYSGYKGSTISSTIAAYVVMTHNREEGYGCFVRYFERRYKDTWTHV